MNDLDTHALESYLDRELDGSVLDVERLSDKVNLVLTVETDEETYLLRRPNAVRQTDLFNGLHEEYDLLVELSGTDVPTQTPVLYCEDDSLVGDPFLVTTYLEGTTVPLGTDLPERFRDERSRRRVAELLVDTLADVHSLETGRFEDVCERQHPLDQVDRAVERLEAAEAAMDRELSTLRSVGEWLRENAPAGARTTLVHGDYRPGNVLLAGRERVRLTGVLDWETAILGDPLTDVGYLLLRWRDPGDPTPSLSGLRERHPEDVLDELQRHNEEGLCPFSARVGSPTRRDLIERYEERTGRSVENGQFYLAHAAFGLATVWVDLHRRRVEAGHESNKDAYVEYATRLADSAASGEFRL